MVSRDSWTIGIAVVSGDAAHRKNAIDEIIRFMEKHADAELTAVEIYPRA